MSSLHICFVLLSSTACQGFIDFKLFLVFGFTKNLGGRIKGESCKVSFGQPTFQAT
jgi:hypothetical protein